MHIVSVLHVLDCAGGRSTLDIVRAIAEERRDILVEDVVVEDPSMAAAMGFRGSPTVLVDGTDVEQDPQSPLGSMG